MYSDVSHQEKLCISIRWVDSSFNIDEAPIELIRVPRTDSATLTSLIKDCLVRCILPLSQCRGQALTMELAQLIRFSPKRSSLFESLQAQLSPGAPSLKPLCPTRWTVRTRVLGAIASNYAVLTTALLEIHEGGRDEYALKAGGYLATMDKFSTYFGVKLSYLQQNSSQ